MGLIEAAQALRAEVEALRFAPPVAYVYDPLEYAWAPQREYLERYGSGAARGGAAGDEPGALRHGADRGAVRRRRHGARLARHRGAGRPSRARAPEAPGAGLRLPARRGQRAQAVGLGARAVRQPAALLRALFRRQLLPARVHGRRAGATSPPTSCRAPSASACSRPATGRCARASRNCAPRTWSELDASPPIAPRPRCNKAALSLAACRTPARPPRPQTAAGKR